VIVAAFTFENVRLMLLSGIGQAYDPVTNKGTTGRNYAYQTANGVTLFSTTKTLTRLSVPARWAWALMNSIMIILTTAVWASSAAAASA
jgi:hypothetical protein